MVPHSIWDTLISHVRSVEVPENVNARDAVTPEAGPTLRYTKGEEDIRNSILVKNVLKCPDRDIFGTIYLDEAVYFQALIFFA